MPFIVRHGSTHASTSEPTFELDVDLVAGLLADDHRAWRIFRQRYDRLIQRCITRVSRRFSTVFGKEDVREVHATFYVSLLTNDKHKLRSFDPARGSRLSTWLGLLAINATYDHLRSMRREPPKECLSTAVRVASETPDPFELTSARERARIVHNTLSDFSKKDRTFAALYFVEGVPARDIASKMKISVKTVYSKRHKIESRLKGRLTNEGKGETSCPKAA